MLKKGISRSAKSIQTIREYCIACRCSGWVIPVVVFLLFFVKQEMFYRSSLNLFPISWLWNTQDVFWPFYLPKLAIALIMTSIILFFKRKYWIVAVSFLWDVLFVAELVYFRANGALMNAWAVTMVGNMGGFWSSVLVYLRFSDLWFFLLTFILWGIIWLFNNRHRYPKWAIKLLVVGYLISAQGVYHTCEWRGMDHITGHLKEYCLNPLARVGYQAYYPWEVMLYCNDFSIYHYILYQFNFIPDIIGDRQNLQEVTEDEIKPFINEHAIMSQPSGPLFVCLVESLENWAVTPEVMPHLSSFIERETHLLYAKNVKSERLYGSSADGQMIVETGLLPIQEGAACFRYPGNAYPSLNELYDDASSATLVPHMLSIWNQAQMNVSYRFDTSFQSSPYDKLLFADFYELTRHYSSVLTFTMSSHTPFLTYADSSSLSLPENMPATMSNYLKTVNVADMGLKIILDGIEHDSILSRSTVVITADHSIFDLGLRNEFQAYCHQNAEVYDVMSEGCPLIIYSPSIKEKHVVEEPAFQMDIYPTVLDVLGVEHYWKGVGVSLMQFDFNNRRIIDETSAFSLCDRLIRTDYFRKYQTVRHKAD